MAPVPVTTVTYFDTRKRHRSRVRLSIVNDDANPKESLYRMSLCIYVILLISFLAFCQKYLGAG